MKTAAQVALAKTDPAPDTTLPQPKALGYREAERIAEQGGWRQSVSQVQEVSFLKSTAEAHLPADVRAERDRLSAALEEANAKLTTLEQAQIEKAKAWNDRIDRLQLLKANATNATAVAEAVRAECAAIGCGTEEGFRHAIVLTHHHPQAIRDVFRGVINGEAMLPRVELAVKFHAEELAKFLIELKKFAVENKVPRQYWAEEMEMPK